MWPRSTRRRLLVERATTGRSLWSDRPDRPDWGSVIVRLRNPTRTVNLEGGRSVVKLLHEFGLNRESVLVVRNGALVPGDAMLVDSDEVELRPVISGGGT